VSIDINIDKCTLLSGMGDMARLTAATKGRKIPIGWVFQFVKTSSHPLSFFDQSTDFWHIDSPTRVIPGIRRKYN
jgi:hypothetical protein